jgi:hypothetical protein
VTLAPPSAPAFDAFVDRAVHAAAATATDFADLLVRLPGIGPTDALRALAVDRADTDYARLRDNARALSVPDGPFDQGADLPLPHPLDMEWRFSQETVQSLLDQAVDLTSDGDAILLLGVPSIAAAARRTTADRQFLVTGEDNVICEALERATTGDARFVHRPNGRLAAAAIIDPPWYIDAYAEMLGSCSARCAADASVLLALPPIGVRPSAEADRSAMLAIAAAAGFAVTEERQQVGYRTPLFEIAAWRAAGIGAWLPDWRTGEMIRIVKRRAPAGVVPVPLKPPAFELTLEGVRLKLLLDRAGPATVAPIVEGEVLPSVSARLPGRDRASLWTSSNRAFAVDSELAFAAMTAVAQARGIVLPERLSSTRIDSADSTAIDAIRALTHQIDRLAMREIAIAGEILGDGAWLRTLNDVRFSGAPWRGSPRVRRGAAA